MLGSRAPLSTMYARNILLRRQEDFQFSFEATLKVPKLSAGQNLGITCYYDENTYLTCGLHATGNGYELRLEEHVGLETTCSRCLSIAVKEGELLTLKVDTDYLKRSFSYHAEGGQWQELVTLDNVYYLCDEGIRMGKRFTGAMVGVYAYSGEYEERLVGEFKNMIYTPAK